MYRVWCTVYARCTVYVYGVWCMVYDVWCVQPQFVKIVYVHVGINNQRLVFSCGEEEIGKGTTTASALVINNLSNLIYPQP